jgi:hypothetical protein
MRDNALYVTPSHYYGHTIFSDDLRYEIDGKLNYIGVYNGVMYFPANQSFPVALPKLSAFVWLYMPVEKDPKEIELLVSFPGDKEDAPSFRQVYKDFPPRKSVVNDVPKSDLRGYFRQPLLFSPVSIASTGLIEVTSRVDDEFVRLGGLYVRQQSA